MKEVVASGRTVEDAKREALRELGVNSEEDVEIEVIDEGSKGVFGWGTKFARVKVKLLKEVKIEVKAEVKPPEKEKEEKPAPVAPKAVAKPQPKPQPRMVREKAPEKPLRKPPAREEFRDEDKSEEEVPKMMSLEPSWRPEDVHQPIRVKSEIPPITVGERPLPVINADKKEQPRWEKKDYRSGNRDRFEKKETVEKETFEDEDDFEYAEETGEVEMEEVVELLEEEEGGPFAPRDVIKEVMRLMGADGEIKLIQGSTGPVYSIEGGNLGMLIGKHGQTLEAVQFVINLIMMRRADRKKKITIDVEGYRVRREKSLKDLARRLADKARRERRNVVLEPMLPSERRIIHLSLQNNSGVFTYSQGEEPMRRVVISPKKKRTDENGQPERPERTERTGRYERTDRSSDRPDRPHRTDRYERTERR